MNGTPIDRLFGPESVAVVGASPDATYSGTLIENLLEYGFAGELYLVNPNRERAWGRTCYDSIDDVPTTVDLVIVSVPRQYVVKTIRSAGERGVPIALVITAGFAEADETGRDLEKALADVASETGIRVCGPNTLGVASGHHGTVATSTSSRPPQPGPLGLVSQSGALAFTTFFERAADERIDFGYVVATGNEADLTLSEYVTYLAGQDHVDAICAYIEGLEEPRDFMVAAENAVRSGTAVIAIKVGKSDSAAAAALSHTGSVTGDDDAWDAAFEQVGVERVHDVSEMLSRARAHAAFDPPETDGVCIASTSGGLGSLLADMAATRGIEVPSLEAETEQALLEMDELLTFDELHNPIDIRGYGAEILTEIADVLFDDDGYDVYVFAIGLSAVDERAERIVEQIETIAERVEAPIFVLWTGRKEPLDRPDPQPYERLRETVPVYYDPGACMDAIASLVRFGDARERLTTESARTDLEDGDRSAFEFESDRVLSWTEAESLLESYDLDTVPSGLAHDPDEAVEIADEHGYPVVLKVDSPGIPHRTEADAVRIDLESPNEVRAAYERILDNARSFDPDATIDGVLVQPYRPDGVEALAGITDDPTFGPLVTVAPGGRDVELHDGVVRVPPLTRDEAERAIRETALDDLLDGYRDGPEADIDSLASAVVNLGRLAANEDIAELDLNPILVDEDGISIVDILVRTG
ncbi:acetyltransferase [Natronorubrum sediminis]|uniref:acetate--CoA ligase (ADP-forming) n=1 Tax=Natronorubrum sediminis TaxID=640943 RepID=A0A1H6G5A1_9EURY|nr:acetate--CoA ligase family protein [Natronorubrum sediminis]SEH17800.1 acetyltransferase [Natronorubrum sediminis]